MEKVKIFWKESCPNCPPAKELGRKLQAEGVDVEFFNVNDADGLTEAVLHGVMTTPSVVVLANDGSEKAVWRGVTPKIEEIKAVLT
ncbi:MAG: thioredoxin family protein [Candidatus Norongarragalinales archaeon]